MRKRPHIEHYEASLGMDKANLIRLVEAMLNESDNFFVPEGKCPKFQVTKEGEYRKSEVGNRKVEGEMIIPYSKVGLSFQSPMPTPYEVNNTVYAHYYPSAKKSNQAIILCHHRGGDIDTLAAMARLFANRGISAVTILMPYHGVRAPCRTPSGELFTSANIKRTIDAFRQAVLDIHWATDWLQTLHQKIGIVGISLGGIVAALAGAHDERLKTACICHSGADLAAVTFRGIATQKIKEAFQRINLTEAELRNYWQAIDPVNYIYKMKETHVLQLNTTQDTVFPLACQKKLSLAFKQSKVKYQLSLFPFPCGHYSAGKYTLPKLYLVAKVFLFVKRYL